MRHMQVGQVVSIDKETDAPISSSTLDQRRDLTGGAVHDLGDLALKAWMLTPSDAARSLTVVTGLRDRDELLMSASIMIATSYRVSG
jgi:hypothetical protein